MFPRVAKTVANLVSKNPQQVPALLTASLRTQNVEHRRHHHHHTAKKSLSARTVQPIQAYKGAPLIGASTSADKEVLTIDFDGASLNYPSVWLRDNCRCDECFDHNANSRLIDQQIFKPDTIPTSVKVEANNVKIVWDDGHRSEFAKEWLCDHSFAEQHQIDRENHFHEERFLWNAELFPKIYRTYNFDKVLSDDETLLQWLVSLARYGVTMVTGAPTEEGIVQKLAERVAFIRKTLYGEVFYVKSQEGATNTAYKKGQLQMHSDMPFYHHLPGSIFLHCIVQSRLGGDNLLTDGVAVAQQLSREQYRALTETVVNWSDVGKDGQFHFHSLNREPCICEDKLGNIRKINWSQPQRDSRFDVTVPQAIEWYKAMTHYSRLLHHPSNSISLKMQPGDILTFDNRRVLHSRANYADGARQLNGAYLDWDEIYPKIRVLRKALNNYQ